RYARRGLRYQAAQPRPLANALRTTRSTFAQLPLKNDAGDRVMFGATESYEGRSYAALRSELLRGTCNDERRRAALFFAIVDVASADGFGSFGATRFLNRSFVRYMRH